MTYTEFLEGIPVFVLQPNEPEASSPTWWRLTDDDFERDMAEAD